MKDTIKFSDTCIFPNNIADITSISMECNYESDENKISGDFLIEGSYRAYELSINQDNFSYKLPFEYTFKGKVDDDSATVEIDDFTYEIEDKELKVNIEYSVSADLISEPDEIEVDEDFDRFIIDNDIELVDLTDTEEITDNNEEKEIEVEEIYEEEPVIDELEEKVLETDTRESDEEVTEDDTKISNTIINNIRTTDDEYITYKIYVCAESDTLESISNKFKISIDILKSYNDIDKITAGLKLIIPGIDE